MQDNRLHEETALHFYCLIMQHLVAVHDVSMVIVRNWNTVSSFLGHKLEKAEKVTQCIHKDVCLRLIIKKVQHIQLLH